MRIHAPSVIKYSQLEVFETYRDHLADLVQYMDNIEKIEVAKREETASGILELENHWYAKADIPKAAQAFVKPEMLRWIDYARWNQNDWTCEWRIETFFMADAVQCGGKNRFDAVSDGEMRLTIEGDLSLDTSKVPGVPRLLGKTIKPALEKFVVSMITPNFETINRGILEFLNAR